MDISTSESKESRLSISYTSRRNLLNFLVSLPSHTKTAIVFRNLQLHWVTFRDDEVSSSLVELRNTSNESFSDGNEDEENSEDLDSTIIADEYSMNLPICSGILPSYNLSTSESDLITSITSLPSASTKQTSLSLIVKLKLPC